MVTAEQVHHAVAPYAAGGIDAVRTDGGLVHIRPVQPEDIAALLELHDGVSERSRYLRFFSFSRTSAVAYVRLLVQPASKQHVALCAWIDGRLVGVAAFERISDTAAEVALLVADEHHHQGIGTLLLEHLAAAARRVGIAQFDAEVLAENGAAVQVLHDLGFHVGLRMEGSTELIVLDLTADERALQAMDVREQAAGEASLRHILSPASVAVVGAGSRPDSVGHQVLRNILDGGFTGTVYAVNPHHDSMLGVPCVPSAADLPTAVDLAVIAVPADQVPQVVRDCGEHGVRGLLLLTAGYSETGEVGQARQREVIGIARRFGMRVVGPNCLGVQNTDPAVRLNATFAALPGMAGPLGLVSQSGALGIAVIAAAARWGLGVSQFVSVGNKADVSSNDLLLDWQDDDRIKVVALYLESFGNPRKFARIARSVAARKPIVAIKAGRSAAGRRAGQSHTAAAASSDVVVDAMFQQAGVLRVDTMQQMLDVARILCDQPLPPGRRVAVIGNSGGPGILAADAAESAGLQVVPLSAQTESLVRRAVPTAASCRNPIDLGAGMTPDAIGRALRVVLAAPEVDAVLTIFTDIPVTDSNAVLAEIGAAQLAGPGVHKPVIVTRVGAVPGSVPTPGSGESHLALPVFTFPEPAAAALALAARYAAIRSAKPAVLTRPAVTDTAAARRVVTGALAAGQSWLAADDIATLLGCYGIPVSPQAVVRTAGDAVAAAAELGYPVAVKVAVGGLHKTDIGGVRLGISSAEQVRAAFDDLAALCPDGPVVLVQPMQPKGTEVIVGAVQDPLFGPAVMIGAGGVLADLIADRTFRLAPVAASDAAAMVGALRTARLFDGYRGAPVVSRPALADLLVRVGVLADDLPEVAELDLNPVICRSEGLVVVDARIRVAVPTPKPDPALRQLR
jgi:acyl-CoA synthetase (NDP forming)/GNAT superfamily N-acetyltransferase